MGGPVNVWRNIVLALLTLCVGLAPCRSAFSMEGIFDREAEIRSYISVIETGSRREFIEIARKIYMSGIGDERLARALQTRLQKEIHTLGAPKNYRAKTVRVVVVENRYIDETDISYGKWLLDAACSTGAEFLAPTFEEVANRHGTRLKDMRVLASYSLRQLGWHRHKNELMASRQYHSPNDDPQVSRLVNLLHAEDPSYREFVYDYIHANQLREPRYFEIVSANVLDFISRPAAQRVSEKVALQEIRLLGDSDDRQYIAILQRVMDAKVDSAIKAQAQKALSKLQ